MTQKQTIELNNGNQTQSSHKNRVCGSNMVTEVFTETIYKGWRIIHIKKYIKQLFYSTYTIYINVTQMMLGKQWVKT